MLKNFIITVVGLMILGRALPGWGKSASTSTSYFFQSDVKNEMVLSATSGRIMSQGGSSLIDLNVFYGYFFAPQIEGAVELNFRNASSGGSSTTLFFDGFYNFQTEYLNSFFAFAGLGFTSSRGSSTSNIKFGGGKRWAIWSQVALMPMVWLQKNGSDDVSTNIMPLNFSIMF